MAQILVVDDEVGIRELLSEILEDEGHQVALAESAADARRVRELGRSAALADAKKRLAQLAPVAAPLMLRGERGMRAELFARLLVPAGAPFIDGTQMLDEAPSELLGRASGGVLFIADLSRLERAGQRHLEFLLPRADKHKARLVSFSPVDVRVLVEKHEFDPDLCMRLAELTLKLPTVRGCSEEVADPASLQVGALARAGL